MNHLIAPSILSADMTRLGEEVESVLRAGADMIHFDVMDNHYVPNLTLGPMVCKAIHKRFPGALLDVHLMTQPVDTLIEQFSDAGASRLAIHGDACIHLERALHRIQTLGCKAGLALNPADGVETIEWVAHRLDFILVMTVNPGFGGQSLIPPVLDKISRIKQLYPNIPICVDGGVTAENIASIAQKGADEFVAGSAIFNSNDYKATIKAMRLALESLA